MEISYATGGHQALTIVPTKADPSIYSGVINAVQSDFTYYAKVYDAHTDSFNVQAVPRPPSPRSPSTRITPNIPGWVPCGAAPVTS